MRTVALLPPSAYAKARQAVGIAARVTTVANALFFPFAAAGNPVTLKLSFFTSDQTVTYLSAVKPFVDAVNLDGAELLHIEYF